MLCFQSFSCKEIQKVSSPTKCSKREELEEGVFLNHDKSTCLGEKVGACKNRTVELSERLW